MATPIDTHGAALLQKIILEKKILPENRWGDLKKQAVIFKQTLFQYIMQYQCIEAGQLQEACCDFLQLKKAVLIHRTIHDLPTAQFPLSLIKNHFLLPIEKNAQRWVVAIGNPDDIAMTKTLAFQLGLAVEVQFARYDHLYQLHNAFLSRHCYHHLPSDDEQLAQTITHQLLSDAIHRGASDIHFEPYLQHCRVRFRIDGLLHEIISLPAHLTEAITSCVKVRSGIDIAIKRMPQDGRLTFHSYLGFFKDCRVSTCPTMHGEKSVIRLLDANTHTRPIETLGLQAQDEAIILNAIAKPHGLILVTGPTGSGKTITLYTLLNLLNQHHRNIATIEDPVEMSIDGINQTHINNKAGLTFSQTLRALLRQDPNVIMIGEIRDPETAEMAIRAAQTGHLVLSTLHTNSAPEAIARLSQLGISPGHLCTALTLVIAQRLVRKLCPHCQTGCVYCVDGFFGRTGIFEVMPIEESLKAMIQNNASPVKLALQNKKNGRADLWRSALLSAKNGVTSLDEIYRVISRPDQVTQHARLH